MNHCYRLVWNQDTQRYVPAPECAKGKSKNTSKSNSHKALVPAAIILSTTLVLSAWAQSPPANTLPTGSKVTAGQATISQSGNQMTVNQGTNKAIIDWSSFNIGSNAGVTFQQPNASAIALNRVTAGDASQIHGSLTANGQVWLVNPNGIVFGKGSKVDVGGLVASTMNIANDDFLNGKHIFNRNGAAGSITNHGEISAKDGGYVALLAPAVSNDGIIRAQLGSVVMAAGEQITLQAGANGLLNVQVDPSTVRTLIENKQLIVADGGQVVMTGKAADALSASVVANTGTIQANRLQEKNGQILLIADMRHGETKAAGRLEAKFIDTSAATVSIDKNLKIDTKGGEWLIDPVNITIDSAKATAIEAALGTGNVTVSTADSADNTGWNGGTNGTAADKGDISVDAAITWNNNTQLTLRADNDIRINASITAQNANGKLALRYGQGSANGVINGVEADYFINMSNGASVHLQNGQNFSTHLGSGGTQYNYTVVNDAAALQAWNDSGNLALGSHLDLSGIVNWNPIDLGGRFDGLGHTVNRLTITSAPNGNAGLFGYSSAVSDLRHIGVVDAKISVNSSTGIDAGALVGLSEGSIRRAYATGAVTASGSVNTSYVGGLVGYSTGANAKIDQAYAQVNVRATGMGLMSTAAAGGLVGMLNQGASISNAYAAGTVSADSVNGYAYSGGLVGYTYSNIRNAYATGAVTATHSGSLGSAVSGGLVGLSSGSGITDSVWNTVTTGQSGSSGGGTGKTSAEMLDAATYANWDFSKTWRMAGTATGAGTDGYVFNGLPTLQGVTPKTAYQYFDSGKGDAANPWALTNWQQLQNINQIIGETSGKYFALKADLDKSTTGYYALASSTADGGKGFKPIGDLVHSFTGTFDGQNHTIADLHIQRSTEDYVGLFGRISGATLGNVGLAGSSVLGRDRVGALVGEAFGSSIDNVYAMAQVQGNDMVGGLVGMNWADAGGLAQISNAYATGQVTGHSQVGGLVGRQDGTSYGHAVIDKAYATGQVTGDSEVGALLGLKQNFSDVVNSFYATTGQDGSPINSGSNSHGTGKTLAELQKAKTFADAGWDIDDTGGTSKTWRIYEDHSGPLLRGFLTQVTVTAKAGGAGSDILAGKTYDGSAGSAAAAAGYMTNAPATLEGNLAYTTTGKNAGTYRTGDGTLTLGGLYSGQQGYDISYALTGANASLTIDKKALTVAGTTVAGREYNGSDDVLNQTTRGNLSAGGVIGTDQVTLGLGSATLDSKNAGSRTATVVYGLTGADAGNYTVADSTHSGIEISKKELTVSGTSAAGREYNGSDSAAITVGTVTGYVSGEALNVTASGQFDSKNAGNRTATAHYTLADGTGGGLADNYTLADTSGHAATIDKLAITGTIAADGKTYDGGLFTHTHGRLQGVLQGDVLTVASTSGRFVDKNAGTGKTVHVTGTVEGADADNYDVTFNSTAQADIDAKALDITASDAQKTQGQTLTLDGGTGFAVGAGLVAGERVDSVQLHSAGTSASAAAGSYAIAASDAQGSGGFDAGNYRITYTPGTLTVAASTPTPAPQAPMDGGVIWRKEQEQRQSTLPPHWQQSEASVPAASSGVAHLTLAPDFIQLQEDQP